MGNPHSVLGRPNERGRAMARGAVARLAAGSRHVQRDLQRLGQAWFSPTSSFRSAEDVPHAEPLAEDLRVVLPQLTSEHAGVVSAAFSALRCFAIVCRHGAYPGLPPSLWDLPAPAPVVAACLASSQAAARLRASALVCDFPHPSFRGVLLTRLEDPIFTVRWLAVRALARNGSTERSLLLDALSHSTPRQLDRNRYPEYFDALDTLGTIQDTG